MSAERSPAVELGSAEHRAALAEAELRAAEEEVAMLRGRLEGMTALLVSAREERAAMQHWLDAHRQSLSWRITEPLRAAKRAATGYRGR